MFFAVSKIAGFFIQPLNLSIVLLLLAMAAQWRGRRKAAAWSAGVATVILLVSAWTSLGAALLAPLEGRYAKPSPPPEAVTGIIVLGGGFEGAINLARGGYELNAGGDRFVEAAVLARRYPQAKVVVTGGTGALVLEGEGDGATAPRLLSALGVDASRLVLENASRNTVENAEFTRRSLNPQPGETWLLVTSAFHMPRSMGLFRKAGFDVIPWPVDYRTSGRENWLFGDNPLDSLQTMTLAVREWIGLVTYRLTGRIDTFVP